MKYVSDEIKKLISDKSEDRHPYILIIMECTDGGTNINIESALNGNPVILKGLLSFIDDAHDEISDRIMEKTNSVSDDAVQEKLQKMMTILNQIEELNPDENDKLLLKYFPTGKISSISLNTLEAITKEAQELLDKLKGGNVIKLND